MTDFTCFKCKQAIVFDSEHIGKNGRKIPLDPATHQPHDCPMRERRNLPIDNDPIPQNIQLEDKNDHGNEEFTDVASRGYTIKSEYVDHTLKPELKLKILVDPTAEGLAKQYNSFEKPIKFSQYQLAPSLYTIAVYYEETT